jgi:uncharacterized membrane protein YcaP (DUF421 family)
MLATLWGDTTMHDMFWMSTPVIEKIVRAILIYISLMVGLRLAGKRELAQLNPFDLIILLLLSNTVQNAIIGDDNTVTGGLVGAATLFIINYIFVRVSFHSPRLQRFLGGEPDVLMRHGHIIHHNLEREMITREELTAAAHRQGLSSLSEVEKCVLEPTGTLSFTQRKPTDDDTRHQDLVKRLDHLVRELAEMKSAKSSA